MPLIKFGANDRLLADAKKKNQPYTKLNKSRVPRASPSFFRPEFGRSHQPLGKIFLGPI
jgi:hypothetical protein